ncbi:hypothetical protein ZWY2020_026931 [Hordeum vulgare]|nr:hypothetical protein ZWY2020_026931 [Hordeum vulgare]
MVLVLLGHSTHARNCCTECAYTNPFVCLGNTCHKKCTEKWGKLLNHSSCKAKAFFKVSCDCLVCDL